METIQTLDVRTIEPRLKHITIFNTFDGLQPEESFIIINDHDPKPLYYQFVAERPDEFSWEYKEEGPTRWQVEIGKASAQQKKTIGELAAEDHRKALVFKKFGLDFCCGGKRTIEQAAKEKGIDAATLKAEIAALDIKSLDQNDYSGWPLDRLISHIIENHHAYVKESLPQIYEIITKVVRVHAGDHPELKKVLDYFKVIESELTQHMYKEEEILFPYIYNLSQVEMDERIIKAPAFGTIKNPIKMMEQEHEGAGGCLSAIRELTNNYSLPSGACGSYRMLFGLLQEFEEDLLQHVHLENNLLFPKAIKLESHLYSLQKIR